MLTDRAKGDFEKWYLDTTRKERADYNQFSDVNVLKKFYRMLPFFINASIVEWLDSVGIYIEINHTGLGTFWVSVNEIGIERTTRYEATSAAIETANKIYNTL